LVHYIDVNMQNCIYAFVPCIMIQLCDVNQQNGLFKSKFKFSSSCLLHVSNILCFHHQEGCIVHAALRFMLFMHLCKQSSKWKDVLHK